ncbi:cas1 domain-containing protein 1-like [Plakobranchus ocellatus]|uniref:Cas1 domain-containing protein 1-like n=1 Tax=Plakobranchus ocellatus TaxID=259542 RepID=A0AAV4B0C0_9GAST|nr:cas1 domain-containing protein 1-like [Plakobranchus ocellatus]
MSAPEEVQPQQTAGQVDQDPHTVPQYQVTHAQLILFIAYLLLLCFWTLHFIASLVGIDFLADWNGRKRLLIEDSKNADATGTANGAKLDDVVLNIHANETTSSGQNAKDGALVNNGRMVTSDGDAGKNLAVSAISQEVPKPQTGSVRHKPGSPPRVTLDRFLTSVVLFGAILFYFYMCDYLKIFPQGERTYSRDMFLFLVFLFFLVACAYTVTQNEDKILNRDQTEEWKGWMQVMFVWYHYFKAKEWYNWIRIYIACYVWMTGFGNFSFFWVRSDFSLWRMLKMLFRLNFLVIFVAIVTNNEYMLYYICAMHTYWFLTVYVFMRVLSSWNRVSHLMAAKFLAYAVFNAIVFDIPGVSQAVFRPLHLILGLHNGKPDIMHEWSFRAGLDHWACFFGMLCAYNYPHFEHLMAYVDSKSSDSHEVLRKLLIRLGLTAACLCAGFVWFFVFMGLEKYPYNSFHPYTSLIPILCFIILRNIHPVLRSYHIGLFAWLGKITLETYLSQLHIYLLANARTLLTLMTGYPMLNFCLVTILYLAISHRLFLITNDCSSFLLPSSKDMRRTLRVVMAALLLLALSLSIPYALRVE